MATELVKDIAGKNNAMFISNIDLSWAQWFSSNFEDYLDTIRGHLSRGLEKEGTFYVYSVVSGLYTLTTEKCEQWKQGRIVNMRSNPPKMTKTMRQQLMSGALTASRNVASEM